MSGEEDESYSSPPVKRRKRTNRDKLWHAGRCYNYGSCSLSSLYYRCASGGCLGRANVSTSSGEVTVVKDHICEAKGVLELEHEKIRKAAFIRLRELTLEAVEGDKAIDIVRRVIGELSPEKRVALSNKVNLRRRVTDYARKKGVTLAKSTYLDLLEDEGDEGVVGSDVNPPPETSSQLLGASIDDSHLVNVKKEPTYDKDDQDEEQSFPQGTETEGVKFLKEKCSQGKPKVKIGDQIYVWVMDSKRGESYKCQERRIGCRVTVRIFPEREGKSQQRQYEIRGTHVHKRRMLPSERKRTRGNDSISILNLVDEEGRDLGAVPLDCILTAGSDPATFSLDYDNLPRVTGTLNDGIINRVSEGSAGYSSDAEEDQGAADNDNDFPMEFGGDDFEPEVEEPDGVAEVMTESENAPASESELSAKDNRKRPKGMKSGEKCFVCGDDLILSEAMSSNQETFRKACCYLNVKTESDWFPQSSNGQINYFCESCTTEITRIQKLYQKVEEIQSLIFQKVEHVEKRIADAVIVDNWLVEAPPISAIRLEGFRKQVLINYRNKLKLRREIRVGRKMGHVFKEVQPNSSANMFAIDPAETDAFRRVASTGDQPSVNSLPVKRGRGRPKSKSGKKSVQVQSPTALENQFIQSNPASNVPYPDMCDTDDGDFLGDFDDSASVSSVRETKFWEGNPSQLQIDSRKYGIQNDGDGVNDEDIVEENSDESADPLGLDNDDEDWETSSTRRSKRLRSSTVGKRRGRPSKKAVLVSQSHTTSQPIDTEDTKSPGKPPPRKSHSGNIIFPDAVLRKDGRVFMSGIEIIKNPPGTYARRPDSVSFTCGACNKIIRGFWDIRSHICGHHLGMFNCTTCEKQFVDRKTLAYHMKRDHSGSIKATPCPICQRPIITNMQYHRWSHLSEEEKKDPQYKNYCPPHKRDPNRIKNNFGLHSYMCSYCSKVFYNTRALRAHELSHTGDAPSCQCQCQYCGKIFNNRKCLHGHNQRCSKKALGIESPVRYPCPKCTVNFKSHQARQQHVKRFHSNLTSKARLPYSCPKCSRSFGSHRGFKSHKLVCTGRSLRGGSPQPPTSSRVHHEPDQDQSMSMSPDDSSSTHPSASGHLTGFAYNMFGNYQGGNI